MPSSSGSFKESAAGTRLEDEVVGFGWDGVIRSVTNMLSLKLCAAAGFKPLKVSGQYAVGGLTVEANKNGTSLTILLPSKRSIGNPRTNRLEPMPQLSGCYCISGLKFSDSESFVASAAKIWSSTASKLQSLERWSLTPQKSLMISSKEPYSP